jgi:nitrate reductase assembly molybdenum cofactor insertion protein NarJ
MNLAQHPERASSFLFGSILSSYPDQNFSEYVQLLLRDPDVAYTFSALEPELWAQLTEYLADIVASPDALRDLQSLYIDIFERASPGNPLYETEYGRSRAMAKGVELLDIAAFYKSFGFSFGDDESQKDMIDHLAIELEFYALMLMKLTALREDENQEGVEIVDDGRKKFLMEHLGRFTSALMKRPGIPGSLFYFTVMRCVHSLITNECQNLGLSPIQADWLESAHEEEIKCGTGGSCLSGNPDVITNAYNPH